jgi:hypothetical protein
MLCILLAALLVATVTAENGTIVLAKKASAVLGDCKFMKNHSSWSEMSMMYHSFFLINEQDTIKVMRVSLQHAPLVLMGPAMELMGTSSRPTMEMVAATVQSTAPGSLPPIAMDTRWRSNFCTWIWTRAMTIFMSMMETLSMFRLSQCKSFQLSIDEQLPTECL